MYRKTYQAGFVLPPIIIILSIILAVGVGTVVYQNRTTNQLVTPNTQESTSSAIPQPSTTPSPTPSEPKLQTSPTVKPSSSPTPTPTPSPTPSPIPKPKPICSVTVIPSSSGTAPLETSICVGNNSSPYQAVQQELVDYDGEGNWNYQGAQYGCHSFTFQNPGTYNPKAKIIGSSGEESDTCQTSVTIN